jgi:predicted unusual protein kinase regulating ubiquinone biosynthesis (AarF/ABC1/UbiB family)
VHHGNIIYKSYGKSYAIDFGYAFSNTFSYTRVQKDLYDFYHTALDEHNKRTLVLIYKQLFFWINFIKNNKSNLTSLFANISDEIFDKLKNMVKQDEHTALQKDHKKNFQKFRTNLDKLVSIYSEVFKSLEKELKKIK